LLDFWGKNISGWPALRAAAWDSRGTIKSDVHRLKQRYRELSRAEIANTVSTPAKLTMSCAI